MNDRSPGQGNGAQPQPDALALQRNNAALNGWSPCDPGALRGSPRQRISRFAWLGRTIMRYPWFIIAIWGLVFVASVFAAPRFHAALTGPPLEVIGSDSSRAQEILSSRFAQPFVEQDLIVFESDDLVATDPAFQEVIAAALRRAQELPGIVDVISPFDPRADRLISADGHIATAVVGLGGSNAARQAIAPRLTAAATAAATEQVRVYVTGPSPLIIELVEQEQADLARAEQLGLPLALLILLISSGAVVAAGIPLLLALTGVLATFGVLGAAATFTEFNLFVPNIATMIGLGVGIDYALFIVNRFREELARGAAPRPAVVTTVATAGKTVFFSALTVLLSLSGLFLVNARIFHELALGAMTAVAVMAIGALTLVPASLVLLGKQVNALRLPGRRQQSVSFGGVRFWSRWAQAIMRHPGIWATVAVIILLALAAPITRINLALDTATSDAAPRSAGMGREILKREFNEGRISPLQVVYVSENGPLDDSDLDAIARLSEMLSNDWAVVQVISPTTLLDQYMGNHTAATLQRVASIPEVVVAAGNLVNVGGGSDIAVIRAVPRWSPDSPGPQELVRRVRQLMVPSVVAPGASVYVGGLSAQIVDISAESRLKLPVVIFFVVALSFVLLAIVFRSVAIPIKAIIMNVLSIAAAYGLLVVVFQEGAGAHLFDFTPTGQIQVYLPLLTFAVLFGLSMDYEVFLLGRIKEEWERTKDNQLAVVLGLERTGAVITSAAAIMVVVFAAFTFARLTEVKTLGFSLAAAVLIDATLIRLILVPAAMQLLGSWNWWFPAWLDKRLPRIDLSEQESESDVLPNGIGAPYIAEPSRVAPGSVRQEP